MASKFAKRFGLDVAASWFADTFAWLMGGSILSAITAIWAWLSELSGLAIFLIALVSLCTILWVGVAIKKLWPRGKKQPKLEQMVEIESVKICASPTHIRRTDLDSLEKQIKTTKELWVSVIAGHYYHPWQDDDYRKIKKMILCDPNSSVFQKYVEFSGFRGPTFKDAIESNLERCKSLNVPVRLASHPIMNVAISDPGSDESWIRYQWIVPFRLGNEVPITMIYKKDDHELHDFIWKSFDRLWDQSGSPNE